MDNDTIYQALLAINGLPAFQNDKPYTVFDGVGEWSDGGTRQFIETPLGSSLLEHNTRMRMLSRLRWSESDEAYRGRRDTASQADETYRVLLERLESIRMARLMQERGLDTREGFVNTRILSIDSNDHIELLLEQLSAVQDRVPDIATIIATSYGTKWYNASMDKLELVSAWLKNSHREGDALTIERLQAQIEHIATLAWNAQSVEETAQLASSLYQDMDGDYTRDSTRYIPCVAHTEGGRTVLSNEEPASTEGSRDKLEALSKRHIPPLMESAGETKWGNMTIESDQTCIPVRRNTGGRKSRPAGIGFLPRHIDRYVSDMAIFTRIKRYPGGTTLIDHSGSMGLSTSDVMMLILASPSGLVATYSGHSGSRGGGKLRIIVNKGRMVEQDMLEAPSGSGNIVDMPALMWLAKQPRPLFWVSDGFTSGRGGNCTEEAHNECAQFAHRYGILRLPHVAEAVEVLRRATRVSYTT